jgi:CRP/FNR family transcriptional regulator, anaerobic regulatory protein
MSEHIKKIIRETVPVNDLQLQEILSHFTFQKFKKNELILREGSVCRDLYFIDQGMIRTFIVHEGSEVTTWVALPGTIETSAKSFLRQIPSDFSLQAIQDCEVLVLNRDNYYKLLETNKAFNILAGKMLEGFYLRVEDKFYSYLFLSAAERLEKMQQQFPDHFRLVPLKYLASILRVKPETLSRLRKRRSRRGN